MTESDGSTDKKTTDTKATDARAANPEREQRILEAAKTLILRYGYDKTTVSDIAREAGVSKGAIYLHFSSKEDLFSALFEQVALEYVVNWLDMTENDPEGGTFVNIYQHAMVAIVQAPLLQAVVKGDRQVLGNFRLERSDWLRMRQQVRKDFVKQMQAVGGIRDDLDPQIIAYVFNVISYGMLTISDVLDESEIPPLEDFMNTLGIMMDAALAPPDGMNHEASKQVLTGVVESFRAQIEQRQQGSQIHTNDRGANESDD